MPLLTLLQTLCFILSLNTSWSDGNIYLSKYARGFTNKKCEYVTIIILSNIMSIGHREVNRVEETAIITVAFVWHLSINRFTSVVSFPDLRLAFQARIPIRS